MNGATTPPQPVPPAKQRGKGTRIAIKIVIVFLAIVVIVGIIGGIYAWRFIAGSRNILVGSVNLSQVPDGTYTGSYSFFHDSAEVRAVVQDHRITELEFLKAPTNADESILRQRVLDQQSLEVDLVTGATVSQKVILKALENALTGTGS